MLQIESKVNICDNSGGITGRIIHIDGSTGKKCASIGDRVKIAISSVIPNSGIKKGDISSAVIVRVTKRCKRLDGTYINWHENSVVLITEDRELKGTRIRGSVPREMETVYGYQKIVSYAQEVI